MKSILKTPAALAFGLFAAGCGNLVDMGKGREVNPRRVYVNDAAANDSLPPGILSQGVLFVLQPGRQYALRMKTPAAGDRLDFYAGTGNGNFSLQQSVQGTGQDGVRSFPLQATKGVADYYFAVLRAANGGPAILPDSIRLVPVDTTPASTVAVRLLMVGPLHGYAADQDKMDYAQTFLAELRGIFSVYGVTVDTDSLIVDQPDPLTVVFGTGSIQIPGTRRPNAINLYLVDSIRNASGPGMVLGFAPREALDLAANPESRVVLNVRGGSPVSMAVTAAHEMGHFLGLRHTTATAIDRQFDNDESNRNDGFASTPFCNTLEKRSAGEAGATLRTPGGQPYCLRVAGGAATCGCPDAGNLMYPYACNPSAQKALGEDQEEFLRANLGLYP